MQNGFITHYNVTIVRSGSTIYSNHTLSTEIETTLMEMFQSNMNYTVNVAAVNSAGTGPSTSSPIQIAVLQLVTQTSFDPTTVTEQASFQTPATTNILGTTQVMVCVNLVLQ